MKAEDLDRWRPSLRAISKATSYSHYLELMAAEEANFIDATIEDMEEALS